ncbi:hypothetical protein [Streptomyces sp. NPDC058632]
MPDLTHDESPEAAGAAGAPLAKGGVDQGSGRGTDTGHRAGGGERVRV